MNPDTVLKLDQSDVLDGLKLAAVEVGINRHFQASWASQCMGCMLHDGTYEWTLRTSCVFYSMWNQAKM